MVKKNYDKSTVYKLIREENFKKEPFNNWGHPIPKLIVGCWNFFRLNDVRPNLDFTLAKKYYPTEKKDCYTVGFLQAYLMHSILGCNSITMIDIDWRILEAHYHLTQLYQSKKMLSEPSLLEGLKTLTVNWVAKFNNQPMEKITKASLDTFCFYEHHKMCKENLLKFQEDFFKLDSIFLRLSALHNFSYKNKEPNTKVIYLSNAIDDLYTNKSQFERMIQNIYANLEIGQKVVFIHHSAGWPFFGIYEMTKKDSPPEIRTVCKDVYKTTPVAGDGVPYITHFERWNKEQKNILSCAAELSTK